MSSLTKENIPHLCRACLRKLGKNENGLSITDRQQGPAFYHIDRTNSLRKWVTIINPLEDVTRLKNNDQHKQFPQYVCRSCYENFKHVNDFKEMVVHSFSVLSKLLASGDEKKPTQVGQPVAESELIVKSEPIDDDNDDDDNDDDDEDNEDFDDDEYMENDWEMKNDVLGNATEMDLLQANLSTENSGDPKAVAMELTTSSPPLENGDIGQPKATKNYKCTICNINYINKYTYVAHMKQTHIGIENAFECDVCHKSYTQFCNLYRHMRTAHNQSLRLYKCEYPNCNRSFRQLTIRRKHYDEFHNHEPLPSHIKKVIAKCRKQDVQVTFQHSFMEPSTSFCNTSTALVGKSSSLFSKRNNICSICARTFETSYDLKVHTNNDHKKDMKFRCDICGASKISKSKLDQHMFTVHNSQHVLCDFCQKSLKSKSHLRQHILSVHSGIKPFSCEFCPARFAAKNTLKVHTRIHTGEKPFKCNVCERRFSQLTPMKKHLITHEKGHRNADTSKRLRPLAAKSAAPSTPPIVDEELGQPKAIKAYKCRTCKLSYIHKYTYVAHIRQVHMGIEHAFECDICHKAYTKFPNLYRHMRREHNQSLRQFKCEYKNCNRSFRQLPTRRKHYEEFHNHEPLPTQNEFVSKECPKQNANKHFKPLPSGPSSSSSSTMLLNSVSEVVNPTSVTYLRKYVCALCSDGFETSYDLKVHMNNSHKKDLKYRCNICGIHKISQLKIDEHISTTHRNQSVACHICKKVLKSKSHLRQHILSVHNGIKPYTCEYCSAKFATNNTLKVHTRIHTGEKPFKCNVCERRFTQLTPMKKHLITHEKGHRNAIE